MALVVLVSVVFGLLLFHKVESPGRLVKEQAGKVETHFRVTVRAHIFTDGVLRWYVGSSVYQHSSLAPVQHDTTLAHTSAFSIGATFMQFTDDQRAMLVNMNLLWSASCGRLKLTNQSSWLFVFKRSWTGSYLCLSERDRGHKPRLIPRSSRKLTQSIKCLESE